MTPRVPPATNAPRAAANATAASRPLSRPRLVVTPAPRHPLVPAFLDPPPLSGAWLGRKDGLAEQFAIDHRGEAIARLAQGQDPVDQRPDTRLLAEVDEPAELTPGSHRRSHD